MSDYFHTATQKRLEFRAALKRQQVSRPRAEAAGNYRAHPVTNRAVLHIFTRQYPTPTRCTIYVLRDDSGIYDYAFHFTRGTKTLCQLPYIAWDDDDHFAMMNAIRGYCTPDHATTLPFPVTIIHPSGRVERLLPLEFLALTGEAIPTS